MSDIIPVQQITSRIYEIRSQRVMLDRDLAELYGVETRNLKRQVNRNKNRFPERLHVRTIQGRAQQLEIPNWHLKLGRFSIPSLCFHS